MGTTSSTIKIVNDTSTDIVNTSVSGLDSFDFKNTNHPSSKLNGLSINAKGSVERIVDLYSPASHCPVTVTLTFKDKSEDTFRIDLKYVVGCCARFNHSQRSHKMSYRLDNKKIIVTIENTAEQTKNEEAEELLRRAREAMRRRLFDQALDHLSHAKNLASKADIVREIKSEESEVYSSHGDSMFEEGLFMERTERFQAAEGKFSSAKSFFQRSLELVYSGETQEKIRFSELKISGNRSTNTATELENEASVMVANEEYETALDKYEAALRKYKEAKRKFEEGGRSSYVYFSDSVEATEERIEQVDGFIERTTDEKKNKETKELLREAKKAKSQSLYDFALVYLDRAKTSAIRSDTLDDIENEESRVCSLYGETMFKEGLDYEQREDSQMAQQKFDKAESLLRRSLTLESSRETQQKLRLVELKINGNKSLRQAMELENQALVMNENKQYEKALNIYLAALTIYKEVKETYLEGNSGQQKYFSNSVNVVNEQIKQVEATIQKTTQRQQAKALMKKVKEAMKQRLYNLALEHLEGAKKLANQSDILENIKNEESRICSLYGVTLFGEGLDWEQKEHSEIAKSKFAKAESLFRRSLRLVNSSETRQKLRLVELKINGCKGLSQGVKLENQAIEMSKNKKYELAMNKYHAALTMYKEVKEMYLKGAKNRKSYFSNSLKAVNKKIEQVEAAIENTTKQQHNENAKALIKEAKKATKQKLYAFALEHLKGAKILTNQPDTLTKIKNEERNVCSLYGKSVFEEGWELEKEGHSERAESKFKKAKTWFQRAKKSVSSNELQQNLQLVDLKLSGDRSSAEAGTLKYEGVREVKKKNYDSALKKCVAALAKCKEAKEKYKEGAGCRKEYFSNSLKLINEQIEQIKVTIRNTEAQMRDTNAKELIEKAKRAKEKKIYDVALEHLSQAEVSANQTDTITDIRKEENEVCRLYGTMLFEEGLDSEKKGKLEEAKIRFHKTKSVLQRGMKLVDCEETKKKLRLVELKIGGDKKFNKAVEFDNKASLCQDDEQYKEALDQYDVALGKYKEAKEDYVEGAKHEEEYFARSVKIADEQIERVEDTVNEINSVQMLQGQINGLRIDNRTIETVEDDKEEVESKLQNTFIQR
ncbi:desmoplakin-B-like [Zophobas morio]|uniref:desmoplakin-B-like n=1 Tax=Zophobas morio TaxID=2755281 RepID=UPI003083CE5D